MDLDKVPLLVVCGIWICILDSGSIDAKDIMDPACEQR